MLVMKNYFGLILTIYTIFKLSKHAQDEYNKCNCVEESPDIFDCVFAPYGFTPCKNGYHYRYTKDKQDIINMKCSCGGHFDNSFFSTLDRLKTYFVCTITLKCLAFLFSCIKIIVEIATFSFDTTPFYRFHQLLILSIYYENNDFSFKHNSYQVALFVLSFLDLEVVFNALLIVFVDLFERIQYIGSFKSSKISLPFFKKNNRQNQLRPNNWFFLYNSTISLFADSKLRIGFFICRLRAVRCNLLM